MSGKGFGIDHVTVLHSDVSGNQSLHPDVHYFKGLSVSVHTALQDVPLEMGPTFFCPCTGESLFREEWPASAAIKMSQAETYRSSTARHTEVPTKDHSEAKRLSSKPAGSCFDKARNSNSLKGCLEWQGLKNGSGRDRPVLKLEVAAEDFVERRNYIQLASGAAKKQVKAFRNVMGPPRFGADVRTEL
ncbi:unnamed protein product [Durusdinium trenchii]|uniref:Uncharacterized protein n=1 Tax=Durusdinium trenchii TaxID=1381693 RepID=A0ABP0RE41_9DINO